MRLLHVHERAGFHGGVEQILHDTALGLAARGWPQALLHRDPSPQAGFVAAFAQTSSQEEALLADFAPEILLLHKVEAPELVRRLAERWPTARMIHDHDLVCLRRHKYFPLSTRICDRPAGLACYLHLCFIQKAPPGSRLPITLKAVSERRQAIAAHAAVRRFLVGSRWMRQELAMNGIAAERIEILPPIPAALAETMAESGAGLGTEVETVQPPEILYVGQVIRGKGVDLLLRALALVPPPWRATIAGTGNHLEECRALAERLVIAARVQFTGWIPHGDLAPLYARAALTAVPSRWPEPFGMVGIEAMARGRPVVGFAVGGIPDWLEDGVTGLLAPEADTRALAAAIHRLLTEPGLQAQLGSAGAQRVRERYQPETYLDRLMAILEGMR